MAKWGEGDQRWIVEERPDDTNVNNCPSAKQIRDGDAQSKWFDVFIIFLIIVSSIALALDVPRLDPASALAFYLAQANPVFYP